MQALGRPRRLRSDRRMLAGSLLLALTLAIAVLPVALLEPAPIELEETQSSDAPPPIDALLRPGPIALRRFGPAPAARSAGARSVIAPRAAELRAVGHPRGQPATGSASRPGPTGIPP